MMGLFDGWFSRKSAQSGGFLKHALNGDNSGGISVSPEKALRYSDVYKCCRVISESIGMLPIRLVERSGDSRINVYDDLYNLINIQPNEYTTAREFWETMGLCLAWNGNAYAYVIKSSSGQPLEFLQLNPSSVSPKLRPDYTVVYQVTFEDGKTGILGSDEVLHFRVFSKDGIRGMSPISQAKDAIGLAIAAEKHGMAMMTKGTKLSGVVSTDGVMTDEAYSRVKKSWDDTYSGAENAWKVAILEYGLKFHPIAMTAQDAQFLESRQFQRADIAGLFRVPPHMIGDLSKSTFSNIEHQGQEFVTHCLMPYLTKIENRLLVTLIPKEKRAKYSFKFNANALLRGDSTARGNFYTRMIQNGAMSPNEIRELEDMNPRDGGDIYLTPLNMAIDGKPVEKA